MRYISISKYLFVIFIVFISACSSTKLTVSPTNNDNDFLSEKSVEYETYWEAIENIDFDYLTDKTLNDDQEKFSDALKSVVDGDINNGVTQFQNLYNLSTDSLIKKHSEAILIKLYFLQSDWEKILKLNTKSYSNSELENDIILFEAFSKSPRESYLFPYQPTIIPLDPIFFGSNPMIEVIVNGHNKKFWIDTGAGLSTVASDVAKECGIFPIGTEETTAGTGTKKRVTEWSAGGFEKTETKIIPNLALILNGNVLNFYAIRTSPQKGVVFVKSDGRLGIDIAQDRCIIIDTCFALE